MVDVVAEFTLEPDVTYIADIEVATSIKDHDKLNHRDLPDQHPISSITGLETALEGKQDILTAGDNIQIEDGVISATDTTYTAGTGISIENGVISNTQTSAEWGNITGTLSDQTDLNNALGDLGGGIDSNHQAISSHVSDKNNPHEVTKAQVGLGNVDNTSDLNKPISTATQTALDGKQASITTTNKLLSDLVDDTNQNHLFVSSSEKTTWNGKQNALSSTQLAAVNSGITQSLVTQIGTNQTDISTINSKIPSAASSSNQLADKSYVDDAIQTNSAHFRGNWATWDDVPTNVNDYPADDDGNKTPTVNDYMVVQDSSGYTGETLEGTWQFTYTGLWSTSGKNGWLPRFQINETPFTQAQLDAINSGATSTNIGQIAINTGDISSLQSGKADKATTLAGYGITDAYTKTTADSTFVPQTRTVNNKALSSNITLTASDVGADASGAASTAETNAKNYADSLASNYATAAQGAKADTALQSGDNISELVNNSGYITGITSSDVTSALGYTPYNSSNPSGYTTNVGTVTSVNNTQPDANGNVTISTGGTYTAGDGINITNDVISVDGTQTSEVTLATVATSGSYNDLSNKPTIPAAQVNSDWNANSGVAQILNKPTIPTDTADLTNGAGFITSSALSGYQTTANLVTSVSSSSTDSQYPSAKLFYDTCGDIETLLQGLR